jgi:hypothetical protein
MTDHDHRDQDKPVDVSNAADHRPDHAGAPGWQNDEHSAQGGDQNPDAKQPDASQLQKLQRSQGMNRSSRQDRS